MTPKTAHLPDRRVWLRVALPDWDDPLDPSHAARHGGRWNPPHSFPVLYLNADVATARMQIERLLQGSPVTFDDLDDEAYVLVAATLPRDQDCADAVSDDGLGALGLPRTYPRQRSGKEVARQRCQRAGVQAREAGLRGVWCRSACTNDGRGRECAWFPATARSAASALWPAPLPLRAWRNATDWAELGLEPQNDPA